MGATLQLFISLGVDFRLNRLLTAEHQPVSVIQSDRAVKQGLLRSAAYRILARCARRHDGNPRFAAAGAALGKELRKNYELYLMILLPLAWLIVFK